VTHIDIEPTTIRGERGPRYRVLYAGKVLIEDAWCPEYDAARALLARGITGRAEVWRAGRAVSAMDIEGAAKLTIVENTNAGPRVGPWMPFSPYSVAPPAAVSRGRRAMEHADEDGRW
jgi:hypothetical protein